MEITRRDQVSPRVIPRLIPTDHHGAHTHHTTDKWDNTRDTSLTDNSDIKPHTVNKPRQHRHRPLIHNPRPQGDHRNPPPTRLLKERVLDLFEILMLNILLN